MDILAHALWSGAVYQKKRVWWAVLFGIAPDLFSFGVFFVIRFVTEGPSGLRLSHANQPYLLDIPAYVFSLYQVTHSFVIWSAVFILAWLYLRRVPWEFTAWGLHVLVDIPTHTTSFFPTPFLWPLPQPFFINSLSWGTPWFMALNYGMLAVVYAALFRAREHL